MRRNTYLRGSRRTLIQQLAGTCSSKAPVIASETAGLPRYRCRHACLSWYTTASRKQQRLAFGTVYLPDPPARHGGMPLYPVRQETREMDARSLAQAIPRPTTVRQLTIVWSARHTNPARPSTSSKFRGPASRNPGNVRHGPGPHRGLYETCWVRLEMGRSWEYVDIQQIGDMWGNHTPHNYLLYTVGNDRPSICFSSHTHVSSVSSSSA
jgi:hypothetical protein